MMASFIALTHWKTRETVYIRGDMVISLCGLPPRDEGTTKYTDTGLPPLPARTSVMLGTRGETFDGVTRPANFVVLETPAVIMERLSMLGLT